MQKNNINNELRRYIRENLSPTDEEKSFVSLIYESFKKILNNSCLQIGSYPRYTAIRPMHDLDILYIIGNWTDKKEKSIDILTKLKAKLERDYVNPTKYEINYRVQTHSVTITYSKENDEYFSVDIVPAYIYSKNNYNEDTYKVPEVLGFRHGVERKYYYEAIKEQSKTVNWIKSDPRGYIQLASRLNLVNDDFRRSVKFIKAWKSSCNEKDDRFKLKSFHIEQVIVEYLINESRLTIFDLIFKFFIDIPSIIYKPQIKDRADDNIYIDEYINGLNGNQKDLIEAARDCFLRKLERIDENSNISFLIDGCFYNRVSDTEEFLFDNNIPTLTEKNVKFKIDGRVRERKGYSSGWLSRTTQLLKGLTKGPEERKIDFEIVKNSTDVDYFMWKVKNDNNCERHQRRGEITKHNTRNTPETTAFSGNHYVEAYAIKNQICVAKYRVKVKIL